MKFNPKNRHLWIIPEVERETEDTAIKILTPDDYTKPKSAYLRAKVLGVADDCKITTVKPGNEVIIERRMLHNIEIEGKSFYLVMENYVFGSIDT